MLGDPDSLPEVPNTDFQSILGDAYLLRSHRRFEDAWHKLDDLRPIDRTEPETLALRLLLCAARSG